MEFVFTMHYSTSKSSYYYFFKHLYHIPQMLMQTIFFPYMQFMPTVETDKSKLSSAPFQRKDHVIPASTCDISAETRSGFFQDKVRAVRDDTLRADRPTFNKLTDFTDRLHIISVLLHGEDLEVSHLVSAEVLFTGAPPKSCSLVPCPCSYRILC